VYEDPNWPLVVCLGGGIVLLGAMAVAESGRMARISLVEAS
jgi:hypothetical protein